MNKARANALQKRLHGDRRRFRDFEPVVGGAAVRREIGSESDTAPRRSRKPAVGVHYEDGYHCAFLPLDERYH